MILCILFDILISKKNAFWDISDNLYVDTNMSVSCCIGRALIDKSVDVTLVTEMELAIDFNEI